MNFTPTDSTRPALESTQLNTTVIIQTPARTARIGHYPKNGTLSLYSNGQMEFICLEDPAESISFANKDIKRANIAVSGSVTFDLNSGKTVTLSYGYTPGGVGAVAGGSMTGGSLGGALVGAGVAVALNDYGDSFAIGDKWKAILIEQLGPTRVQTKSRTQLIIAIAAIVICIILLTFGLLTHSF